MSEEISQPKSLRLVAWLVLSSLFAILTLAAPLVVDGQELSAEEGVGAGQSPDGMAFGHDLVPAAPGRHHPDIASTELVIAIRAPAPPHRVNFRSTLLHYAPKQSPPRTT